MTKIFWDTSIPYHRTIVVAISAIITQLTKFIWYQTNISTNYPFLRISVLRPETQNIVIYHNDSKCLVSALSQALRLSTIGIDLGCKSSTQNFWFLLFTFHFNNVQLAVISNSKDWTVKWWINPPYDSVKLSLGRDNYFIDRIYRIFRMVAMGGQKILLIELLVPFSHSLSDIPFRKKINCARYPGWRKPWRA